MAGMAASRAGQESGGRNFMLNLVVLIAIGVFHFWGGAVLLLAFTP